MITNFVRSRVIYEQLAYDDVLPQFSDFIQNPNTWPQLDIIRDIYEALASVINVSQSDSTNISEIPEMIARINSIVTCICDSEFVTEEEKDNLIQAMIQRFDDEKDVTMCRRFHYLANILNPKYKGITIPADDMMKAEKTLTDYYTSVMQASQMTAQMDTAGLVMCFHDYLTSSGVFKNFPYSDARFSSPLVYWKSLVKMSPDKDAASMAMIAERLLSMPASSAAVERSFSLLVRILTKYRCRLTSERLHKLQVIATMDRFIGISGETDKKAMELVEEILVSESENEEQQGGDDMEIIVEVVNDDEMEAGKELNV